MLLNFYRSIFLFFSLITLWSSTGLAASPTGLYQTHPIAWMHSLPVGEQPGWSEQSWFQFETSLSNIWNSPLTMRDRRNNKQYSYFADFEQSTLIVESGFSLFERLGVSLVIPYANRYGGNLDGFIHGFHEMLGNRTFNREYYNSDEHHFSIKTDGVDYLTEHIPLSANSNLNLKLKLWLLKSDKVDDCACGLSLGYQAKFPLDNPTNGGTTGNIDQSFLIYLGSTMGDFGAVWFTAGVTQLGDNPAFKDWPRNKELQMYELSFDFNLSDSWGLTMLARAESPFLQAKHLEYIDANTDSEIISRNRAASGWNSLVRWRGTDSLGLRYKTKGGSYFNLSVVEDWGIGPYDASDDIYSNGAPDVNFVLQSRFDF
jgi:hypothetical protein